MATTDRKEYMKAYREKNKEKQKEYNKQYYEQNKSKILNEKKKYYAEHKDDIEVKRDWNKKEEYMKNYQNTIVSCVCGKSMKRANIYRHRKICKALK